MRRAALVSLLILASCSGDGQTTTPPSTAPVLTTLAAADAPVTTTPAPTTTAPPTTTSTTTTTTLPPNAAPAFGLSQVVFGDSSFVIITNWGNDAGSLAGLWLSQGDAYQALPDVSLSPGEQALIGLAAESPPDLAGMAAIIDLGRSIGIIALDNGEVGLHRGTAFDEATSLIAYVEWGEATHQRSELAMAAGLWDGIPVAVFDDAPSISSGIYPATSSLDWSVDIGG